MFWCFSKKRKKLQYLRQLAANGELYYQVNMQYALLDENGEETGNGGFVSLYTGKDRLFATKMEQYFHDIRMSYCENHTSEICMKGKVNGKPCLFIRSGVIRKTCQEPLDETLDYTYTITDKQELKRFSRRMDWVLSYLEAMREHGLDSEQNTVVDLPVLYDVQNLSTVLAKYVPGYERPTKAECKAMRKAAKASDAWN